MSTQQEPHYVIRDRLLFHPLFIPTFLIIFKGIRDRISELSYEEKVNYLFNLEKEIFEDTLTPLHIAIALAARAMIATYLGKPYPEPIIKEIEEKVIKIGKNYGIENSHLLPLYMYPEEKLRYELKNIKDIKGNIYKDLPPLDSLSKIPKLEDLLIQGLYVHVVDMVDEKMMKEKYSSTLKRLLRSRFSLSIFLSKSIFWALLGTIFPTLLNKKIDKILDSFDKKALTRRPEEISKVKVTTPFFRYSKRAKKLF